MVAVSESTPGPLGVNMATYVGFQTLGILGGIWATLSPVSYTHLGLRNLTVIQDTVDMIKENRNIDLDVRKIPYKDKATSEMLCQGDTIGAVSYTHLIWGIRQYRAL